MKFEDFKLKFDQALASISQDDLIKAFEAMGCEFEDIEVDCFIPDGAFEPVTGVPFFSRAVDPAFEEAGTTCPLTMAADSNELALAA